MTALSPLVGNENPSVNTTTNPSPTPNVHRQGNHVSTIKPPRLLALALFLTALIWAVTAHTVANRAANGLSAALNLSVPNLQPLLHQIFFLLLILVGFATLDWISTRTGSLRGTNALPGRPTTVREFRIGAALGWGIVLITIIPTMSSVTPLPLSSPTYKRTPTLNTGTSISAHDAPDH